MKRLVRTTALLLTLSMLFFVLSACENGNSATTSQEPSNTGSAASATSAADPGATEPEPEGIVYPLSDEPIELSMWLQNSNKTATFKALDDIMDFDAIYEAERRTGVIVDYQTVSSEAAQSAFGIMIASDDYCDMIAHVIAYYNGGLSAAYTDGVVIDVSEYLEEYSQNYYSLVNTDAKTWASTTLDDGEVVGYLTFANIALHTWGMGIRQDWLDELGLNIPTTVDEIHDTLTAFKTAYDPSHTLHLSKMSQFGSALVSAWDVPGYQITGGSDGRTYMYQVDGTANASFLEDSYREYLATMNQWYNEGLISQDFASVDVMPFTDTNLPIILSDNTGIFYTASNQIADLPMAASDPDFAAVGIPSPTLNEGGTTHFITDTLYRFNESLSISKDCPEDKIEYAMKWIDWWYAEDGTNLKNFGIQGETWEYNSAGQPEFTDMIWESEFRNEYSITAIISAHTMMAAMPCGADVKDRLFSLYGPETIQTLENWNNADGDYLLPSLTFTVAENDILSSVLPDVETLAAENIIKFITGARSLDTWDAFVEEVKSVGMEEALAVYQAALDRFTAKTDKFPG